MVTRSTFKIYRRVKIEVFAAKTKTLSIQGTKDTERAPLMHHCRVKLLAVTHLSRCNARISEYPGAGLLCLESKN